MKLGAFNIRAIEAERFKLDGGAMHGVVPKTLWAPLTRPDEHNRVEYTTRCLLLESANRRILVETGNGDKWTAKEREMFAIEPGAGIAQRLRGAGVEPDTIDTVVLTHLHFDHVGGASWLDGGGTPRATFLRAHHITQRKELEDALHPNERNRASYRQENLRPLVDGGLFQPVEGEVEVAPGVRVVPTPGHTPGHQSVLVTDGSTTAFFCGDVMPTSVHLRLPWIMAFDVTPLTTLETKRWLLDRAVREHWILIWGHDLMLAGGRVSLDGKGSPIVSEPATL